MKGNEDDLLRPRVRPPGGAELGPQEGLLLADHDEGPSGAVLEYIDDYHYENDGCNTADYEEWDDYYYERLPTD